MNTLAPLPPGPKGRLFTGSMPEFHKDILGFYTRCAQEYGDCVRFRLGRRRMVLISRPDLIEQMLVHQAKDFAKLTYLLKLIVPLLGKGLLTSDGEFWLKQRRLIQPVFNKQRINSYGQYVVEFAKRRLDDWQDGEQRDMLREMYTLALEVIAKVLFDANVANEATEVGEALNVVMDNFLNRWGSFLPLPPYFPTHGNLRFYRSIRQLDNIIYRFIEERRASKEERNDLLSVLLHARDEDDGTRMTDRQLRDEAMTLFLAGHETTANAMGYTWYLLANHPHVAERLREEVDAVAGNRLPTAEDIPRLKLTESVILESMRLYPPAYAFARVAKKDCEFNGFRIPRGTTVVCSQWVMHRDPRYWLDAEKFHPDRWLDGSTKDLPRFVYFPFGGGPRQCIGNSFAMMETVLILATMIRNIDIKLVPGYQLELQPAVTMTPKGGIPVSIRKR